MGYLDNTSITVDAVLTKKGREILKNGGNLNISSFTCSDTGVDYSLWNPDHPDGSDKYGQAIENLPQLEASVHAEYNLRNRLISLNQNTSAIPSIVLGGLDSKNGALLTFNEGDELLGDIQVDLLGYNSNASMGKYLVIQDPSVISTTAKLVTGLSGTSRMFLTEQDINHAQEYSFMGAGFKIQPLQQDKAGRQTNVYVVDRETGAYNSFTVTNNITKNQRAVLSSKGIG